VLFQPLHLLPLPRPSSPAQGWEALLSRTPAAKRKAFGVGREAGLQAQVESKATAEPAASLFPPRSWQGAKPRDASSTSLEALAP